MTIKQISATLFGIFYFTFISIASFAAHIPSGTTLHSNQILNRGNSAEPATLDPSLSTGAIESNILFDLFETLVLFDSNGQIKPGCAESWTTQDNQTFIFHLHKNAKWSDGNPLTADHFVYGFQRTIKPETGAEYAEYYTQMNIKNAKKVILGLLPPSALGVRSENLHTLIIELESPLSYLPDMLAHPAVMPLPKHVIEKYGSQWTQPKNIVSNGAFKMKNWVVNERIELVKNPYYWDAEHVVINQVNHLPIAPGKPELHRYLSGDLDITHEVPSEHFTSLKAKYPDEIKTTPKSILYYYLPNLNHPPLDNPKVRKALALSIDRDLITQKVIGRGEIPCYTLVPADISDFSPNSPIWSTWTQTQRIQEAKRLLHEAGFSEKNPLSFTLLYESKDLHKKIALAVSSMWKKNLGIKIELKNQEWKTYLSERRQRNFELSRASWLADYNEASTFLNLLESSNPLNEGGYKNHTYDRLLESALKESNAKKRAALYQKALDIFEQDMPLIPVHQDAVPRMVKSYVGGYTGNPMNVTYSKDLYIAAH